MIWGQKPRPHGFLPSQGRKEASVSCPDSQGIPKVTGDSFTHFMLRASDIKVGLLCESKDAMLRKVTGKKQRMLFCYFLLRLQTLEKDKGL